MLGHEELFAKNALNRMVLCLCFLSVIPIVHGAETFWYYVVHRDGLSEVIDLKKVSTYDKALEGAQNALARMSRAASAAD